VLDFCLPANRSSLGEQIPLLHCPAPRSPLRLQAAHRQSCQNGRSNGPAVGVWRLCSGAAVFFAGAIDLEHEPLACSGGSGTQQAAECGGKSGDGSKLTTTSPFHCCGRRHRRQGQTCGVRRASSEGGGGRELTAQTHPTWPATEFQEGRQRGGWKTGLGAVHGRCQLRSPILQGASSIAL